MWYIFAAAKVLEKLYFKIKRERCENRRHYPVL
jgi:hypothetical protein